MIGGGTDLVSSRQAASGQGDVRITLHNIADHDPPGPSTYATKAIACTSVINHRIRIFLSKLLLSKDRPL
jgi:hypothetical protein